MFQNNKLLALLIVGFVWLAGILAYPGVAKAACWTIASSTSPVSCDGRSGCTDSCTTYSSTDSEGTAWYSCGEYCWHETNGICDSWGQGCYMHVYGCDTSCGASTPPSCFVPGTLVGNSSGGKKIEDVKVGDTVMSFKDDKIVESAVSKIYKVTRDFYFKLVADDYEVKVTAEHPFYIGNDKFEEVQNLKVGDSVYVNENKSMMKKTITSLERTNEPTDAYNMTVGDCEA